MNTLSRIITGTIGFTLGLVLTIVALLNEYWILIYGIPLLIIGAFIIFNKHEDDIEKIKGGKK